MLICHDKLRGVKLSYNEHEAEMTIWANGQTQVIDEDECDRLLRLYEYSSQPVEDLAEFFDMVFSFPQRYSYRIAEMFAANASEIGKLVYL